METGLKKESRRCEFRLCALTQQSNASFTVAGESFPVPVAFEVCRGGGTEHASPSKRKGMRGPYL